MRRTFPMFARVFGAMVLMVVLGSWTFASVLSIYQDRAIAETLAPLWSVALRKALAQPPALVANPERRDIAIAVQLLRGPPPASAYDVTRDARVAALVERLRDNGLGVRQVRLDSVGDLTVTWLDVFDARNSGANRSDWVGIVGSVQPGDFRQRLWTGLAALFLLVLVTAWLVSRWVTMPVARLSRQVEAIGRGELPNDGVGGAREIQQLAATLQTMARQRASFDDDRRLMLMGVSHDLRSPLTRVRTAADLLADGDAKLRSVIVRNVEQADAIIGGFADYVRADVAGVKEAVNLSSLLAEVAMVSGLPGEAVTLSEPSINVIGDAMLLRRLLLNLIDNALLHGAKPVEVRLSADRQTSSVLMTVDDAGVGIAEPERMLRPFERGDAARQQPGSGLGLAIVARVVQRHGGTLEICRSPRGGARVSITLPLP